MNILIDTCSLVDLLTVEEENKLIETLNYWYKNKSVNYITHEEIINEWDIHKGKRKKELFDSLNTKYKNANEVNKREGVPVLEMKPNLKIIDKQINVIDRIISNAILIKTPREIKAYTADRARIKPKKAPFHNKLDSVNDAYIIFSTLDYFQKNNLTHFYFISSNKNDFGDPNNLSRCIHPDILEDYKNINIEYYSEIGRAINEIRKIIIVPDDDIIKPNELQNTQNNESNKIFLKNTHILEKIHYFVSNIYKELNFIPIEFFSINSPFKISNTNKEYYSSFFSINTDNIELYEFFKSLSINIGDVNFKDKNNYYGIKNYKQKTIFILRHLSNNLIFYLDFNRPNSRINIRYFEKKKCSCLNCQIHSFEYSKALKQFKSRKSDLNFLFKKAYAFYQVGEFGKSANIFKIIAERTEQEKLWVKYFVAKINLYRLYKFLRNPFWSKTYPKVLADEIKAIDIKNIYEKLNQKSQFIEWIYSNKLIVETKESICTLVSEIREDYQNSKIGGWSSKNNAGKLINEYAKVDAYLNSNCIIYDSFSDYNELSMVFFEGLIASHAIKNEGYSKFKYIDLWTLKKMIHFGNIDKFDILFRTYELDLIQINKKDNTEKDFLHLFKNLLNNIVYSEDIGNRENFYFWNNYNRYFSNMLFLAAYINFEEKSVIDIIETIVLHFNEESPINSMNTKNIVRFIYRKGNLIPTDVLEKVFDLCFKLDKLYDIDIIKSLVYTIESRNEIIQLKNESIREIIHYCRKVPLNNSNNFAPIALVHLSRIIEDKYQLDLITKEVLTSLEKNYEPELYFLSVLYGIIKIENKFFDKFMYLAKASLDGKSFKEMLTGNSDILYDYIDMLLILCYKYDVNVNESKFDAFRSKNVMYEWLFNLKGFNYNKFIPEWLQYFQNEIYYNEFRKHPMIKVKLKEFLLSKYDSTIERIYFNLYERIM